MNDSEYARDDFDEFDDDEYCDWGDYMTDEMKEMLDAFGIEIKGDLNASDEEITKALNDAMKSIDYKSVACSTNIEPFTVEQLEKLIDWFDGFQYKYRYTSNDFTGFIRSIT